jgi:hypothetical protein
MVHNSESQKEKERRKKPEEREMIELTLYT